MQRPSPVEVNRTHSRPLHRLPWLLGWISVLMCYLSQPAPRVHGGYSYKVMESSQVATTRNQHCTVEPVPFGKTQQRGTVRSGNMRAWGSCLPSTSCSTGVCHTALPVRRKYAGPRSFIAPEGTQHYPLAPLTSTHLSIRQNRNCTAPCMAVPRVPYSCLTTLGIASLRPSLQVPAHVFVLDMVSCRCASTCTQECASPLAPLQMECFWSSARCKRYFWRQASHALTRNMSSIGA